MLEQKSSESCASTPGDLPPELKNGSWSENTDKIQRSDSSDGSESVSVDDGCLSHESNLLRSCNSLPRILLADSKYLSKYQACLMDTHVSEVDEKVDSEGEAQS